MQAQINLYDTSTAPTQAMREAMYHAEVGDDVYGEDPTVNELESEAAALVGKEATLLVPSGTMGNLIALMVNTHRGEEVILEAESHIYYYEAGGMASVAGLMPRPVVGDRGRLMPEHVLAALRAPDQHYPHTSLLCVENTHNRAGGSVTTPENMRALRALCDEHGLRLHLDGARVFNAAVALNGPVTELTCPAHTVMFCLSKGLGAPIGSILAGDAPTIEAARRVRKMLGGGMRQAGLIAAAGLVSLRDGIERLRQDHALARQLAARLNTIPGLFIDLEQVHTNMIMLNTSAFGLPASTLAAALKDRGIRVSGRPPYTVRMVTHHQITPEQVEVVVAAVGDIVTAWKAQPELARAV
ncbi:MAG: aminotransferase class I/II-fold pyridoxal phosphate-dependent enzyme [Anaerolineales bacterium]|nr:aminotransferase class I/II-fold pyridoxal phosphate-dependent enzyme [Anaerolineales bacterium]